MNRRGRTRFKTDLSVRVSCPEIPGCILKARLADLSVHGLSLILNEELQVASLVKVEWASVTFVGEVIYCQSRRGEGFLIGLKVEDPVYETAKKYASQ